MENVREDRSSVYELGFLLAGLPEEKVAAETEAIKGIITKNGGTIIAEESPKNEKLAYTMRKKLVSGSYQKYDEAYFGWVKFEAASAAVDTIKKAVEALEFTLRIMVITTVRENTYLGKRAPAVASASFPRRAAEGEVAAAPAKAVEAAPAATVEDMDKSIDEMVKEA
ncbi:MAG TPA: 30S ribosomal protein S6 [Candidatus Paceibacterota bacterium]